MFNCEDAISRLIHHLEAQIYQNLEIILINDGSGDNEIKGQTASWGMILQGIIILYLMQIHT